jgi:hypothetical protein
MSGTLMAAINNIIEAIRVSTEDDVKFRLRLALNQLYTIKKFYKVEDEPYP